METVDLIFKHGKEVKEHIHKLVVLNEDIVESLENITDMPFSVIISGYEKKRWIEILKIVDAAFIIKLSQFFPVPCNF